MARRGFQGKAAGPPGMSAIFHRAAKKTLKDCNLAVIQFLVALIAASYLPQGRIAG
jgi:hypothetical protein